MGKIDRNEKVRFYLLGPPKVTYQGKTLSIPRRQVRTLLYLLAGQNQPIPYQTLHFLFWSHQPESICRRNLSHLFTHLRNSLPDKNILVQSSVSATLDSDLIWSDVIEFVKLISKTKDEENLPDFISAHHLYRGSFLEGKYIPKSPELDKFIDQKRLNLEQIYLNNLSNLIMLNKKLNNYLSAIEYAETYLSIDNFNEDILNELLILHSMMGNQGKFIQSYENFSQQLKEELAIVPSKKTRSLFKHIKESFSENVVGNPLPKSTTSRQDQSMKDFNHSNLIALQKIMGSRSSNGGIALVIGEHGMGKSELISTYMNQRNPNQINFRISCNPATQKIRFYPFRELAKQLFSTIEKGTYNSHLFSSNLNNIVSQLSKPVQIDSTINGKIIEVLLERDFSLIQELFQELAKLPSAIVISIENIEWIDEDSLELIMFLSEKFCTEQIAFICSFCCPKEDKLKIFEKHVQISPANLGILHMEDLKFDDTVRMVEEQFGTFPESGRITQQLLRLTGGNPFYISEILEWMKDNRWSAKKIAEIQTFDIPLSVKQKIIARFERLPKIEKDILRIAAVRGSPMSFEEILLRTKLSHHQVQEAVNDLICRNILGCESDSYSIKYEIVRQSILFNINSTQKQMIEKLLQEPISD